MAEKKRISLGRLFENKKIAMITSLVIAIALWFSITIVESPDSENTIAGISVAIPIENTVVSEMGMDIIGDSSVYTASVTVRGPAYVISDLGVDDILVAASISNVTNSGTYSLELRATKQAGADDNFDIISLSPKTINVEFDYIDTKQFEVSVQAVGHKAENGLMAELPFVSDSNNATLNVKGPRTDIEKISKVVAVAEVNKTLSATESFEGALKILDANGKEMDLKQFTITSADGLSAPDIQITVPIYKEKIVPIVAQFINAPKAFQNKKISHQLEHTSVLISGPPETIDKITEVKLSEIDFYQISGNNQAFETTLILPEGVKNKDNIDTVTVKITGLEDYTVKSFNLTTIKAVDGASNVKLSREIRNIKLIGPKGILNKLTAKDLYAEVQLEALESGEHTVPARIVCTAFDNVWQIGTYTASVNIG
ncbi:MAG: hypothetical protein E7551_06620 [Ruminococcaceae bacterium]|nr:hypothetical protein [Oscillospiraceae bacterium]